MKLKLFRICYLVSLILVTTLGVAFIIHTLAYDSKGLYTLTDMMIVNMISYGMGIIFTFFESYMVGKSFRYGTLLINQLCFDKERKRRVLPGVVSSILLALSIFFLVYFSLMRCGIPSLSNTDDYMTYEFLIYYGAIGVVNFSILLTYYIFLRFDDLTSIK